MKKFRFIIIFNKLIGLGREKRLRRLGVGRRMKMSRRRGEFRRKGKSLFRMETLGSVITGSHEAIRVSTCGRIDVTFIGIPNPY